MGGVLKIAGRQASAFGKLVSLRLVKTILDMMRNGASPEQIAVRARRARDAPAACEAGYMCYYRDAGVR